LAGTLIALARQGNALLTPAKGATAILRERGKLDWVAQALARRAADMKETPQEADDIRDKLMKRCNDLLDEWEKIAKELQEVGTELQYQPKEAGAAQRLLYEFLNPELKKLPLRHRKFRANRSMRDVESSVNLWVKTLDNIDVEEDD
jgi:hypothetical protein